MCVNRVRNHNEKTMAKNKYDRWLTKEGLLLLEGWARDGLTDEQIAHNMGINAATLYVYKNKFTEIYEALKNGKEVIDRVVENALLNRVLSGDTTAIIFWLKNRKPKEWRDRYQQDIYTPEPIKTMDMSNFTDDELKQLKGILKKNE
jgi:hypothetical protein